MSPLDFYRSLRKVRIIVHPTPGLSLLEWVVITGLLSLFVLASFSMGMEDPYPILKSNAAPKNDSWKTCLIGTRMHDDTAECRQEISRIRAVANAADRELHIQSQQ